MQHVPSSGYAVTLETDKKDTTDYGSIEVIQKTCIRLDWLYRFGPKALALGLPWGQI